MATALSKRHQARNERALQELIKSVPGNDRCADCGARNPGKDGGDLIRTLANITIIGWASWSVSEETTIAGSEDQEKVLISSSQLGIFLCMRCASLHRQLGTHISKVKSLSMDSWSNEQVEV